MKIDAFFKFTYGLYILSSINDGKFTGHINNTALQVTAEPPQFSVCSHKDNLTTDFIQKSKVFSISIIEQNVDLEYIGHWGFKSGRDFNKFENINYNIGQTGCPIVLDHTVAFLECEVIKEIDLGTHIMFIGKAVDADILKQDVETLTYDYYRSVIKGISPKNSPTYIKKEKKEISEPIDSTEKEKGSNQNHEFICTVCGYVYNPEDGDPTSNIKPGTPFEELPDDWQCPICGITKDLFEKV